MNTATPIRTESSGIRALRAYLAVEIVTPADEGWDRARRAWNLAVDQRPAAVAFPESAEEVQSLVEYAAEHDLRIAPQGTGHAASAIETLSGTILVKTERMRGVHIDPARRVARVEAGALWMDVTGPAAEHGLAPLAGSSPDVGVVGYTLGGGLSWLARKHGLASNHVTAIEVVTADGDVLRADPHNHPDLFWALRGGGGSFGIVTALEFRLLPITEVFAGALMFPIERAREVLQTWRQWTQTVPDEVTSSARILRLPQAPHVPEPLRGRALAVIEAALLTDDKKGAELIAPLRALGAEIDTFATIPAAQLQHLHRDPEQPVPAASGHMMLNELTAEAIDAFVETAGRADRPTPLLSAELRHLGGALNRTQPGAGALGRIGEPYSLFGVGIAATEEMGAAVRGFMTTLRAALARYDAGSVYLNYTDDPADTGTMFGPAAYRRLREVKREYDACDVFRANHPIPPAR